MSFKQIILGAIVAGALTANTQASEAAAKTITCLSRDTIGALGTAICLGVPFAYCILQDHLDDREETLRYDLCRQGAISTEAYLKAHANMQHQNESRLKAWLAMCAGLVCGFGIKELVEKLTVKA